MAVPKGMSEQYLRKEKIDVTIIQYVDPAHYVIRESPSLVMSESARQFVELEKKMQKYYKMFDFSSPAALPEQNAVIMVYDDEKWYRAKVCRIINTTKGPQISVFLLDYGKKCQVFRHRMTAIEKEFLTVPYQAITFELLGLKPMGLVMDPTTLAFEYGPVDDWDESVLRKMQEFKQTITSAKIEVIGIGDNDCFYGKLFITMGYDELCMNQYLIDQKYAFHDKDVATPAMNNSEDEDEKMIAQKAEELQAMRDSLKEKKRLLMESLSESPQTPKVDPKKNIAQLKSMLSKQAQKSPNAPISSPDFTMERLQSESMEKIMSPLRLHISSDDASHSLHSDQDYSPASEKSVGRSSSTSISPSDLKKHNLNALAKLQARQRSLMSPMSNPQSPGCVSSDSVSSVINVDRQSLLTTSNIQRAFPGMQRNEQILSRAEDIHHQDSTDESGYRTPAAKLLKIKELLLLKKKDNTAPFHEPSVPKTPPSLGRGASILKTNNFSCNVFPRNELNEGESSSIRANHVSNGSMPVEQRKYLNNKDNRTVRSLAGPANVLSKARPTVESQGRPANKVPVPKGEVNDSLYSTDPMTDRILKSFSDMKEVTKPMEKSELPTQEDETNIYLTPEADSGIYFKTSMVRAIRLVAE